MSKLVVVKVNEGDWERGFPVILQIGEEGKPPSVEVAGKLPGNRELPQFYEEWQSLYRSLPTVSRLVAPATQVTNVAIPEDCYQKVEDLRTNLNFWVDSEIFRPLKERLLESLDPSESIRVIIQTADSHMRQLPWHLLKFFEDFQKAEVAISAPFYEKVPEKTESSFNKIRILAILGNSEGINVNADREFLKKLPGAETVFLIEPQRRDISDHLWEQPWDIFFFAGHSYSHAQTGLININSKESLTLGELKHGLRKAIEKGLQLAIFNSCDGLGLAQELTGLSIPQVIVMREPVPDKVAQDFLKYFLNAFSQGQSLYLAVRTARERLYDEGLEAEIPGVTWLPVIFQNPAATPLVWSQKKLPIIHQSKLIIGVLVLLAILLFLIPIVQKITSYQVYNPNKKLLNADLKIPYPKNWKMTYPKGWQAIPGELIKGEVVQFVAPKDELSQSFPARVMVNTHFLESPTTLEQYTDNTIQQISQQFTQDFITKPIPVRLGRLDAMQIIYTGQQGGKKVKIKQILALTTNHAYVIIYQAESERFAEFEDTAQKIIDSFTID